MVLSKAQGHICPGMQDLNTWTSRSMNILLMLSARNIFPESSFVILKNGQVFSSGNDRTYTRKLGTDTIYYLKQFIHINTDQYLSSRVIPIIKLSSPLTSFHFLIIHILISFVYCALFQYYYSQLKCSLITV